MVNEIEIGQTRQLQYRRNCDGTVSCFVCKITLGVSCFILGNALVYGNTLEAFSMVQTLLALGLPGSRVVLVQPPLPVPTCFNNPFIEDAVVAALKECGRYILDSDTILQFQSFSCLRLILTVTL